MPPALETIGATGWQNESKYRSWRGTGLLERERESWALSVNPL